MEIAEIVAPYFRRKIKDETGQSARFISVKDIQFNQKAKDDGIEFDVVIQLLSDQGSRSESVIIREFNDVNSFKGEISRYNTLQQRFLVFPFVNLLPMIHIDNDNHRIVYEKEVGFNIEQLGLSQELTDYTLGQITALLHGNKSINLELSNESTILDFLISHLPFTDEEQGSIRKLLTPHLKFLSSSTGGYSPCTYYDPRTLNFIPVLDKENITKTSVTEEGAIQSIILVETPENTIADRMTDISVIFSRQAYDEFLTSGKIVETKQCLVDFLEGYNEISKRINMPQLSTLYPKGSTLNLQMLINFWLIEINKLHGKPGGISGFENKDMIRYTYYLLVKMPFDII
jgi:hypothetical protein